MGSSPKLQRKSTAVIMTTILLATFCGYDKHHEKGEQKRQRLSVSTLVRAQSDGTEELAQQFSNLAAFVEDAGSVPCTDTV